MINKVVKRIDSQGRLLLPIELVNFSSIKGCREIALCSVGKGMLRLRGRDNVKNEKVIYLSKLDDKGRFIVPLEIRQQTQKFELFVFNGDLMLKEARE